MAMLRLLPTPDFFGLLNISVALRDAAFYPVLREGAYWSARFAARSGASASLSSPDLICKRHVSYFSSIGRQLPFRKAFGLRTGLARTPILPPLAQVGTRLFATDHGSDHYHHRHRLPSHERLPSTNPYSVLRVPPTASQAEIKAAFRALAMQYHPDRHAHADVDLKDMSSVERTAKFKQVSEAAEWLSDPSRRRRIDAFFVQGHGRRHVPIPRAPFEGEEEDPSVWRGPRPGWTYSPGARRWRQRFWVIKGMVVFGLLGWGMVMGNLGRMNDRRRVLARLRRERNEKTRRTSIETG